ncbi:double-strand break repair protein AddB [Aliiruegeria haliotis]|uniref:Double-strand break repair protein AddB n=1 Tax=Aliiruegeria haliotis TaxID=1280846 RepID=A0A2T0RHU9_9RHOB|nr:double-strand break repair protein AddB [Aliiruegeria haliotis]PRY20707.1 double-strand break repair protein AddB [Aliiruegeria haliotis]
MADPRPARIFGLPPGVDYPKAVISGLERRLAGRDPADWAHTTVFVNSGRMARRFKTLFAEGPPRLLPSIRLIPDPAPQGAFPEIPAALSPLQLKLELAQLLVQLIDRNPELAPRSAVFDLADSLAGLIDEMHGEGVLPDRLAGLDVGEFADHWKIGRAVVEAAFDYLAQDASRLPGSEARRRLVIKALCKTWEVSPPAGPVVVAGSTGSRGATRLLLEAVARLPEGHVVFPGYDFDMPDHAWKALRGALSGEDHPQYRFLPILDELGLTPRDVVRWSDEKPPNADRNTLISLALRPAPVTDQWRCEGRALHDPDRATRDMSLIEAPNQRTEAGAIALRLRQAVEDGQTAALITPDRMLTRQVAAALRRWNIEPDDSAGEPLAQTAAGRFLRHVATLRDAAPSLSELLVLLKHPLTASSPDRRGPHLRWTRELELHLRRRAIAVPEPDDLRAWAEKSRVEDGRQHWAQWLATLLSAVERGRDLSVGEHAARHLELAETLAGGLSSGSGGLWEEAPGREARRAMDELLAIGTRGGVLNDRDYGALLSSHLSAFSVQDPTRPHPGVMVWGTLEARVQGADLAILASLNDGTWPDLPAPDTWLNRQMRATVGLLLPDRRIGLSAHDFQIAVAAPEVLLTRAIRNEDAETVPSRWVNRLQNLLRGLGPTGEAAHAAMLERGAVWTRRFADMELPETTQSPAPRPSPSPPLVLRPRELPVTGVTRLIRDPYAVYAGRILRLRKLDPLQPLPDARLRGTALHRIMEDFLARRTEWRDDPEKAIHILSEIGWGRLREATPQSAMQALWHARLMAIAPRLIEGEIARLRDGDPVLTEDKGWLTLTGLDFQLTARPDRIDRRTDGTYAVYDYKSGSPPSPDQVKHFEKQLPLEAAMLERDAFTGLPSAPTISMGYISLGTSKDREIKLEDDDGRLPDVTWERLHDLIRGYGRRAKGYTSLRAAETTRFEGEFDQLSRYGEWDLTDDAVTIRVGPEDSE